MKRFWKQVSYVEADDGWRVLLDGRAIKTVGGRAQVVPSARLAQAMAEEWAGQGEEVDNAAFVFRDMADFALDVIGTAREAQIEDLVGYAETDTLCYRADPGEALTQRQDEVWEPILRAAENRYDIRFERISGIIHRLQPQPTIGRLRAVLEAQDDFTLAALKTLSSLAASLTIALAAIEPDADVIGLWDAANLEEDWQAELWGKDGEAMARRERRQRDFAAAARFAELVRG